MPYWSGGGMTNPMTALGDLIVGIAGGVASKLGIGAAGQKLTVVGGTATWQGPSVSAQLGANVGPMVANTWTDVLSVVLAANLPWVVMATANLIDSAVGPDAIGIRLYDSTNAVTIGASEELAGATMDGGINHGLSVVGRIVVGAAPVTLKLQAVSNAASTSVKAASVVNGVGNVNTNLVAMPG